MTSGDPTAPAIDPTRPLHDSLRRLMRSLVDASVESLGTVAGCREDAARAELVRRARKSLKRLRALLPLAGDDALDPRRAALRAAASAAARRLSTSRDLHARRETLGRLARRMRPELSEHARDELERLLDLAASDSARPARDEECAAARAAEELLRPARLVVSAIPMPRASWSSLRRLVRSRWSSTRRRLRRELAAGDDHRLHEVRKSCGRLETLLLIVEPLDHARLAPLRRRTSRIYEDLGLDRDLLLLQQWLEGIHGPGAALADPLREEIISMRGRTRRRLARRIRSMPRAGEGRWRSIRRVRPGPATASADLPPSPPSGMMRGGTRAAVPSSPDPAQESGQP